MIQVMQKDQKLEEMKINFSPYLEVRKDKAIVQTETRLFIVVRGSREVDARRA